MCPCGARAWHQHCVVIVTDMLLGGTWRRASSKPVTPCCGGRQPLRVNAIPRPSRSSRRLHWATALPAGTFGSTTFNIPSPPEGDLAVTVLSVTWEGQGACPWRKRRLQESVSLRWSCQGGIGHLKYLPHARSTALLEVAEVTFVPESRTLTGQPGLSFKSEKAALVQASALQTEFLS